MNITVYGRHHFPGSVLEGLELQFHNDEVSHLEQIRVANIIEDHDDGDWWAVLYKDGHQWGMIPIEPEALLPEPVDPRPKMKAAA